MIESMYTVRVTFPSGKTFTKELFAQDEQEALDRAIANCYADHMDYGNKKDWRPSDWHAMIDEQKAANPRANGYSAVIVPWKPKTNQQFNK